MLQQWNPSVGEIASLFSIIAFVSGWIGLYLGRRKAQQKVVRDICLAVADLTKHSNTQATLTKATLRLVFALGQELVKQGANGELKQAVTDLRALVLESSLPVCEDHDIPA